MAYSFGDSFDCYTAPVDTLAGYWDSGTPSNQALGAGRFAGSQAYALGTSNNAILMAKSSGQNDPVHHIAVAFRQTAALSGTSMACGLQLLDGTTGQCCINFRSDGTILLTSGTAAGATLATYSNAFVITTWAFFEFELVINNTTGSFTARKNGNTSADFTATGLNTRVSANNFANKLQVVNGAAAINAQYIDDLFWQSGASAGTWLGDIRCYVRMPAADATVQFAKAPASVTFNASTNTAGNSGPAANAIWWYCIQAPHNGSVTSLYVNLGAAVTGHVNMAAYDATGASIGNQITGAMPNNGPGPGALLGTTTPLTNPGLGIQTFTLVAPFTVVRNQYLWIGIIADASLTAAIVGGGLNTAATLNFTYSSGAFPATGAGFLISTSHTGASNFGATMTPANASLVNEAQQDGTTTYIYDATVGHADFYTIAAAPSTVTTTVAVTTRGFLEKSDAGARTAAMQIKSGATTVAAPTVTLSTGFGWAWRTDTTNPAGGAWTAGAVDAVQIGPVVIS